MWGSGLAALICAVAALQTQHHNLWQVSPAPPLLYPILMHPRDGIIVPTLKLHKGWLQAALLHNMFGSVFRGRPCFTLWLCHATLLADSALLQRHLVVDSA